MRKRFPREMTVLGGFEMTSQTMRVSDPCYDRDVWCCGTFGKCKTGTWEAGVLKTDMGDWGVRCAVLAVRHKETGPDYSVIRQRKVYQMKDGWLEQPIDVGVDSGQAGFYDEAFYQDNSIFKGMPEPEHDYGDLWYNHACDITLSEMSAGIMPYMASSPPPASAMAVMSATRTRVRMARSTSHSSFSLMSNCFLARECFGTPLAVSRRC